MNVLEICQAYGLELNHSEHNYTSVTFDYYGELYDFDFATHMLQGDQILLSKCIINKLMNLASEKAKYSLQLELQGLLGL